MDENFYRNLLGCSGLIIAAATVILILLKDHAKKKENFFRKQFNDFLRSPDRTVCIDNRHYGFWCVDDGVVCILKCDKEYDPFDSRLYTDELLDVLIGLRQQEYSPRSLFVLNQSKGR